MPPIGNLVRIFFHPLPDCAQLANLLGRPNLQPGGGGGELGAQHRHYLEEMKVSAAAVHEALEQFRVDDRRTADWVYVPTWFPFFFWVRSEDSLRCANETLRTLQYGEEYGYNFLVSYPHDYPVFDADRLWEHNLRAWTPYADNFLVLTSGTQIWRGGRREETITKIGGRSCCNCEKLGGAHEGKTDALREGAWGGVEAAKSPTAGMFELGAKYVIVPYGRGYSARGRAESEFRVPASVLDGGPGVLVGVEGTEFRCETDADLVASGRADGGPSKLRDITVAFVGSVRPDFENRVFLEWALTFPALRQHADKLHIDLRSSAVGERHTLRAGVTSARELYRRSRFCLQFPGDAQTPGRRLYDTIHEGCVPVFLWGSENYPVLPPWVEGEEWASASLFFGTVDSANATAEVVLKLLSLPPQKFAHLQEKLMKNVGPKLSYRLDDASCSPQTESATEMLGRELKFRAHVREKFVLSTHMRIGGDRRLGEWTSPKHKTHALGQIGGSSLSWKVSVRRSPSVEMCA